MGFNEINVAVGITSNRASLGKERRERMRGLLSA